MPFTLFSMSTLLENIHAVLHGQRPPGGLLFLTDVLIVAAAALLCVLWPRKNLQVPPGPRRVLLIGNVLDMPKEKEWLKFTEWRENYGDVISLSIFGRSLIILNSAEAALELLHKRSSSYSDRPYLAMGGDLVGWVRMLGMTPYGDHFRKMRRLMHQVLSPRPMQTLFWPAFEQENIHFLHCLLTSPESFVDHTRRAAAAVTLKVSHGYSVSEIGKDPLVAIAEKTIDEFSLSTAPGAFLVDFIPWLKYIPSWFPGAGFRRIANEWRKDLFHMADTAHEFTKIQMGSSLILSRAKGVAIPSLTSQQLEIECTPETEYLVKWTAFSVFVGGADTTVASVTTFFLAMCLHPQVQLTAQAELDAVVGKQRLPTMADRASLHYINAIMKEVLRWGPVGPLGVPHRLSTSQDDVYEGYRIPAGSTVIPNIWAMTRDPILFPDPNEFRPERFMGKQVRDAPFTDPSEIVFGFGRRLCPGQHLAESSVFLSIAMTLATFTIGKARNEASGEIIEPVAEWLPGTISHPKPFPCTIKPRSAGAVELIKQAAASRRK